MLWVAAVAAIALPSMAVAQLEQPRCGGWPPSSGLPGLVIGITGAPCYGSLIAPTQFSLYEALAGSEVRRASPKASFRMIGANQFAYTPSPGQQQPDEIEVALTWTRGSKVEVRTVKLRGYSEESYARAGGTGAKAPPGETVGRPLGAWERLPR